MPLNPLPLFCSEACEKAELVRSFGECPDCKLTWNGKALDGTEHYCNNAWSICNWCSNNEHRCAHCGKAVQNV